MSRKYPGDATASRAACQRYIRSGMHSVRGWLHPVDAAAFAAILLHQRAQGMAGGLAEIGVYCGRSLCLMGQTAARGERLFAADLFSEGPWERGESHQLQEFYRNTTRFGIPRETLCVAVGRSERLRPADIWDAVGSVRFFSVDGGHELAMVAHDASLAASAIAPHGVIAFDDTFNAEWPEVSAAVFDFLRATNGAFVPFAVTQGKLYVCREAYHQSYMTAIRLADWMRAYQRREISMFDTPLVWFHDRIGHRIMQHGMAKLRLGALAASIAALW